MSGLFGLFSSLSQRKLDYVNYSARIFDNVKQFGRVFWIFLTFCFHRGAGGLLDEPRHARV